MFQPAPSPAGFNRYADNAESGITSRSSGASKVGRAGDCPPRRARSARPAPQYRHITRNPFLTLSSAFGILWPNLRTDYKDTLNLPQTGFPMKADLVAREPQRLQKWQDAGLYQKIQAARAGAPKFVLHDGPPFANGDVHIGTALNKILKDIIVKYKTLRGFNAPYIPGWDCHGLPIEFKVTQEMRKGSAAVRPPPPASRRRASVPPPSARPARPMRANSLTSSACNSSASACWAIGTIPTSR